MAKVEADREGWGLAGVYRSPETRLTSHDWARKKSGARNV